MTQAKPYSADSIYFGGDIITMNQHNQVVEAIAIKDGKIIKVGKKDNILSYQGKNTNLVDLKGKALLPGFIDAHGHFMQVGFLAQSANLLPPPDGKVTNFSSIAAALKQHINSPQAKTTGWIIGMGYDDAQLTEKHHPVAEDLDAITTKYPILIIHQSGHIGVVNSKALKILGLDESTKDPIGGALHRKNDSLEPNGVLEENAFFSAILKLPLAEDEESTLKMVLAGQKSYLASGFTTAQEGRAEIGSLKALASASEDGKLKIDVAAYPDPTFFSNSNTFVNTIMANASSNYSNHYRIAGIKLSLDGSPQGKTAWLTHPYHVPAIGRDKDYQGYAQMKDEDLQRYMLQAFNNNWQVLTHVNGDAAIDQFLMAVNVTTNKSSKEDHRSVAIHAQTAREDQLDTMKKLGIIPSFMSVHTYYWGDWHRDSVLGPILAPRISPAKSALKRDMIYTSHNDAPVTPPNSQMILYSQVNRLTRSGKELGPEQKVQVIDALRSITINAAYQYFEEKSKGSLEVGKLADLVILDKNPLKVAPEKLKDIKIIETIKEGKSVFKNQIDIYNQAK